MSNRGVALVELAILLPLLGILISGLLMLGIGFRDYLAAVNALRHAGRSGSATQSDCPAAPSEEVFTCQEISSFGPNPPPTFLKSRIAQVCSELRTATVNANAWKVTAALNQAIEDNFSGWNLSLKGEVVHSASSNWLSWHNLAGHLGGRAQVTFLMQGC